MFRKVENKKIPDYDPEIIAWQRKDGKDLDAQLIFLFPKEGDNIKKKKYFAVKDYEKALFYNKGVLVDVLGGGIYELGKDARIKGTEIVWIDTSIVEFPWGVPKNNGIPCKDGLTVGLHGDLKLKVSDVKAFYNKLVAGKGEWTTLDLKNWIKSLLHTSLRDIFKNYEVKQILLEDRERVLNLVISKVTEEFLKFGLELETFNLLGIKYPDELRSIIEQDVTKTKLISKIGKESVNGLIEQKKNIENRINELKEKLQEEQNKLLDAKINQEYYEKKKEQIEDFIKEYQEELKKISEKISRI